ncbi:CYTH domain-containing protein [Bacillus sp. JCM 19034]|uniref:CYTH domain-containing protein n=1 Tax=Bacillus sp. JCM 19034 TaxID=1481928 RepID=UPI0009E95DFD
MPDGDVKKQLITLEIPLLELRYVGTLTTDRIEIAYNDGTICLDRSSYFNHVDYEIEFEGKNDEHAKTTLYDLLGKCDIEPVPTENKVKRFFRQKEINERQ